MMLVCLKTTSLLLKEAIYENVSEMSHLETLSEPELILISEFISGGPIDTNILVI